MTPAMRRKLAAAAKAKKIARDKKIAAAKASGKTIAAGTASDVAGDVVDTYHDIKDTGAQVKELALLMKSFYNSTKSCLNKEVPKNKKPVGKCMRDTACRKKYAFVTSKCVWKKMLPTI